ncbi:MAG: hypothetical protein EOP04_01385 [Proteobacteria bacterium]|nr:MAG: hypothetical protein EOP04_01385 [Pseudomonadota bacterium]
MQDNESQLQLGPLSGYFFASGELGWQGPVLTTWVDLIVTPLFLSPEILKQKYVDENKSAEEVAAEIGCAVSTVLKHLRKAGVPTRMNGVNIRPKRHLAFGSKIVGREIEAHKREQEVLKQIRERDQGLSYWKVARVLNTLKVRTKTGRGMWLARSVMAVLSNI